MDSEIAVVLTMSYVRCTRTDSLRNSHIL